MEGGTKDVSDEGRARIELLLGLFDHIEQQIGLGETRASLLLAAGGVSAAAYIQLITAMDLWASLGLLGRCLLVSALTAVTASMLLALWAVRPALKVTWFGRRRHLSNPNRSMVEFSSIASQDCEQFVRAFQAKSDRDLQADLLRAIHGKSRKARAKFTELLSAGVCLAVSIALFVACLLIEAL